MMNRDFLLGTTFDIKFTTRKFSSGAPFTLAGSPVISAYPNNSTTQLTAGITLTVDFDGVTGLNNIHVVATGANGYLSQSNYSLVITTGTVDGVSVVGEVVGEFSLDGVDALLQRDMSLVTGEAARSVLNAMRYLRNHVGIVGTTLTTYKEDDTTPAWTSTVTTTVGALQITDTNPT